MKKIINSDNNYQTNEYTDCYNNDCSCKVLCCGSSCGAGGTSDYSCNYRHSHCSEIFYCTAEGVNYETTIDIYSDTLMKSAFDIDLDGLTYTVFLDSQKEN